MNKIIEQSEATIAASKKPFISSPSFVLNYALTPQLQQDSRTHFFISFQGLPLSHA